VAYKIHTGMIFAFFLVVIIISSLETRRTPCGKYTSGSGVEADLRACRTKDTDFVSLHVEFNKNSSQLVAAEFSVANETEFVFVNSTKLSDVDFRGICIGNELNK
jgi:hypothetical protein